MRVAIIAITANGARIGTSLARSTSDSSLFVLEKHASASTLPPLQKAVPITSSPLQGEACPPEPLGEGGGQGEDGVPVHSFSCPLRELVAELWPTFGGFIFIMATGIVVRTIAPLLISKDKDPAVVVVDDAGTFAVSLLSGHLGGANALARRCAELTGGTPVITTATDANDLPSFDMLAKECGWQIEDLSRVKVLNSMLLEGKEIAVVDHGGAAERYCAGKGSLSFYPDLESAFQSGASGYLVITNRTVPANDVSDRVLVLCPLNLCLGIGCNRGTSAQELESVVTANLERLSLSLKSVQCIATANAKQDEAGLLAFAEKMGVPIRTFTSEELNDVGVPSPPSEHAFAAIGAKGVAEPAAVLASGGGRLLLHKVKDGNVTLAIAETPPSSPCPSLKGRGRGSAPL
ncbi:cobalt-precorrin 5A hydrolase [Geomonas sp.]|uniref:cobalt-precorrin 5A hydrolase n=1 Tax=Geomonas sp. TaxID=2651584 RepID=UPI002B47EB79|nr:cobalt-precorrin 5A hydrolase [Geomonas sp.]HJV34422.1 cobalt-precorrin 5A hydrolase [Geomonas sp.]